MNDFDADENFAAIVKGTPTRWTQLLTGMITVADLDDEELVRGQTKGIDGKFHGRGPDTIPRAVHQEIQRRLQARGLQKVQGSYFKAIEAVTDLIEQDDDRRLKFDAAKYIIERVAGKTPDRVEMSVEVKKYEQVLSGVMRRVDQPEVFRVEAPADAEDDS